ncbi:class I SAM-dependent methyltransferase [Salinimicrobium terrae]|uniref:class I SAM-dependent methyltransferase n=1 Tax=Salinimicrobium terrae TaxID=470866 RepID=UPI00041AA85B|nr:class I SAM-dependent methyltransferase [Salinimicrobium terrae]
MECPLCFSRGDLFYSQPEKEYWECTNCKGIFVPKEYFPNPVVEKERYLTHNNDVDDPRYQKFVSPIVESVIENFNPVDHVGLDFGAGTGPVITKLLTNLQYRISAYDPFFLPFPKLLQKSYDFIVCCEVIEHFQNPAREFDLLKSMLLPGGQLFCMTHLFKPGIDFSAWYYKKDPTHIFIYREETFDYIMEKYQFREVKIKNRLITLIV